LVSCRTKTVRGTRITKCTTRTVTGLSLARLGQATLRKGQRTYAVQVRRSGLRSTSGIPSGRYRLTLDGQHDRIRIHAGGTS
jgi:hypothetical protein